MLHENSGYTLIESLVSLALVVAVLIPLGVTLGTFVLSEEGSQLHRALQLAQSEINRTFLERDFVPEHWTAERAFLIHRTSKQEGNLVTVSVAVALSRRPDQPLVRVQKSMVVYR